MANPENLKGHEFTSDQNREQAAINGRKGGRASGETRRRRKAMREAFDELLSRSFTDRNGQRVDGVTALAAKVFQNAMDGDMRAVQFIRDTIGEMPVQRVETVQIDPKLYGEVMDALTGDGPNIQN